jgi:hypothetical protein
MLIPARNIPRIPHITPRQNSGDGEPGNVGKGGKDIPVNDMVSSRMPRKPRSGLAMSAAQALSVARAAGIHIEVEGDDLRLEAPAPSTRPPATFAEPG